MRVAQRQDQQNADHRAQGGDRAARPVTQALRQRQSERGRDRLRQRLHHAIKAHALADVLMREAGRHPGGQRARADRETGTREQAAEHQHPDIGGQRADSRADQHRRHPEQADHPPVTAVDRRADKGPAE